MIVRLPRVLNFLSTGCLFVMASSVSATPDHWDTRPLGPKLQAVNEVSPPTKQPLESRLREFPIKGKAMELFIDGKAEVLLVVPSSMNRTEKRAADLLQSSLEQMSGVSFYVVSESSLKIEEKAEGDFAIVDREGIHWTSAIWIGNTQRAKEKGISIADLKPEGYRLKTVGSELFIVGNDSSRSQPLVDGTYFAVVSLLERRLGFRWLWPGESGTIVPKATRFTLQPLNEQDEPALPKRTIRNMPLNDRAEIGLNNLRASPEKYRQIIEKTATWLANQRTGSSVSYGYGHAYGDWYEKYGSDHPHWFALQPNGSRKQGPVRPRLCKSNPEVAHQAALQVIENYRENPVIDSASISPNDGGPQNWFCMCEGCRRLDPENATPVSLLFERDGQRFEEIYPSLSDRFVTFYNRIAEEVVKTIPEARMGAYAYSSYRDVPLGVKVHPAIIIGFVGLTYESDAQRRLDLQRWDGWGRQASQLMLRPNAFHVGDALPLVYPKRLAEDFKHCYQTGMIAADFDSLIGNWASEGLNYYVLAKLLWDPSLEVEPIIEDYCQKGFGPAAKTIRRYFAELEKATDQVAQLDVGKIESQLRDEEQDFDMNQIRPRRGETEFHVAYFNIFTPEYIASLKEILAEADQQAANDPEVRARIALLRVGLDYAEIYRIARDSNQDFATTKKFLDWYRSSFEEQPLAINTVYRLWRSSWYFQSVLKRESATLN